MAKKSELRFENPGSCDTQLYFVSDTHFWHRSILRPDYSGRPFGTIEEMNETMIHNWNAIVRPKDVVFHLGDFAMAGPKSTVAIIRRLNGRKYLIRGNHDLKIRDVPEADALFERTADMIQIKVMDPTAHQQTQRITLCHYAMRLWNKSHFGTWQLYGHSHGNLSEPENMFSMDVGVDATVRRIMEPDASRWKWEPISEAIPVELRPEYRPISYFEVKAILGKRKFTPIDHHRDDEDAR